MASFRAVEAAQSTMEISIGQTALHHLAVVAMPTDSTARRPPEDGLLPAVLFHVIVFDRACRSVVLNPR